MCQVCGRRFCPPMCPNYSGEMAGRGNAVFECLLCGRSIYIGERFCTDGEDIVCEDCAVHADASQLRLLCGVERTDGILSAFGFHWSISE